MRVPMTTSSGDVSMAGNAQTRGTCPLCHHRIEISETVFRKDFRCMRCGSPLQVSRPYSQMLGLLSVAIGYSLAWRIGQGSFVIFFWGITLQFLLLCLPLSFVVGVLLVRIVPYWVRPPFVVPRNFESHLTTLDLSDEEGLSTPVDSSEHHTGEMR